MLKQYSFVWIYHILFVYLSVGHSGCFQVLVVINIAAISIHIEVFMQTDILIYLGYIYPGRELPDHMITVFKHLRNNLSSKMAVPFYIPASGTRGF